MIFLWGHAGDTALKAVYDSLYQLNVAIAFYDQRQVLDTEIDLVVDADVGGNLHIGDEEIRFEDLSAAYIRPFDSRWLSPVKTAGSGSAEWKHAVSVEDALLSWAEIASAFVINRPSAMSANTSKPYQATIIREYGFEIPETLVTTDPEAALEFWEKHGEVIYKSVSSARSVVTRLKREHLETLKDISWCPTQFQEFVDGKDYRVHVVGDEVFACEIVCSADDYRFALQQEAKVELRPFDLPLEIAERCRQLTSGLGLSVSGIDLRRTNDDKWVCFEANAVPGFTYYQESCNHRIDDAIARLLIANI